MNEERIESAAFALFLGQVETYDLCASAARYEWEQDPALRAFWIGQVQLVLSELGLIS